MNKIICLCGSTKFKKEFEEVNKEFTLKGYIVLAPVIFEHSDNMQFDEITKQNFIELHKRKIDMADEVYIIDVNGYMDKSTEYEYEYAKANNKIIRFYSHPNIIIDESGNSLCL